MMTATDFIAMQSEAFKASNALAAKSIEGMQKLADLNMKVMKSSLESSAEQMKTLMAAKDAKGLNEMLMAMSQPTGDTLSAYAKDVYAITTETNAEVLKMVEKQVEDGNKQVFSAIDAMAKNAPAGSEGAFSFVKQAMTASRSAYEQAAKAGKQVAEMTEANIASATKAATAAKKR